MSAQGFYAPSRTRKSSAAPRLAVKIIAVMLVMAALITTFMVA